MLREIMIYLYNLLLVFLRMCFLKTKTNKTNSICSFINRRTHPQQKKKTDQIYTTKIKQM